MRFSKCIVCRSELNKSGKLYFCLACVFALIDISTGNISMPQILVQSLCGLLEWLDQYWIGLDIKLDCDLYFHQNLMSAVSDVSHICFLWIAGSYLRVHSVFLTFSSVFGKCAKTRSKPVGASVLVNWIK